MMKRILMSLGIVFTLAFALSPATALAFNPFGDACSAGAADSAVCQDQNNGGSNPLTGSKGLLRGIGLIIAVLDGVAAVIIIIVSGFRFVTSGGDPKKAESARSAMTAALVGVVIVAMADAFISLVLSRL